MSTRMRRRKMQIRWLAASCLLAGVLTFVLLPLLQKSITSHTPRNNAAGFEPPVVQTVTSLGLSIQSSPVQSTDSTNVSFYDFKVHESPPFVIFYNIFVPSDQGEKGAANSLRIVQEQLRQVGSSYAASLQRQPTLFYNTIGKRDGIEANAMQILCHENKLICNHMEHYDDGFEQVTLQKIHDFCSIHEDHRVVYLHTKGAYNKFGHNEIWRRHMTAAATSQDCLAPPDDTCNLCGWVYYPFWASFMPGNIWTAQCSYIQHLLPPKEFQRKLKKLVKEVLIMQLLGTFSSRMFSGGEDLYGLNRYADEHWVGSHPAVIPCDVAGSVELTLLWGSEQTRSNFAMAPREAVDAKWINGKPKNTQKILANERDRIKEYYFLGGRLFLWLGLYNQVPPESSWVWNWFPDGARWKNTIAGSNQAMERLIQVVETASFLPRNDAVSFERPVVPTVTSLGLSIQTSPVQSTDSTNASFHDFKVHESPPFVIFYNIFVPSDQGKEGVAHSLRIVQEQLRQVGSSYAASLQRQPTLFYNTIGKRDGIEANAMQILCHENKLICTHMEHYDDGFEQVTLQKIHDFCSIHEDHRVVYLHTKGAYHQFGHTEVWRRSMTAAATSQDCLAPPDDTCNLCGWVYYPFWASFMPGNIWTAQCSYIQHLLPPKEFQQKQRNLVKEALIMQLLGTFSSRMFPPRGEDLYGLNRFADEHWVGSHPAVVPCDVAGNIDLFFLWSREDTRSNFAMAPQAAVDAKWVHGRPRNTRMILANEKDRIREYYFLGGRLFLWLGLYNQVPPESSWVWDWFPDGARWKNTIAGSDQTMERLIQVLETASFHYG